MAEDSWSIDKSPFEVYNVDHGPLEYEICEGYKMIAALYVDHRSKEARILRAAKELHAALEQIADHYPKDDQSLINQIARMALSKAGVPK